MNGSRCKHGIVKTDCETCTTENIKRRYSSVQSTALLGKIRTAWCHYNALNAELEYSLSEGGDTDVTRDQVNRAWEDLNSLITPNIPITDKTPSTERTE